MPSYQITTPDGQKFKITADTDEAAMTAVNDMLGSMPEPAQPAEETSEGFATRENREFEPTRDQKKEAYQEQARGHRERQGTAGEYGTTALRGIARSMPFFDDLVASGKYLRGEASDYQDALDQTRAANEVDDTDRPVTSYGSQIAGGLVLPAGAAKTGATLAQAATRGALTGSAYGAAYGFGQGDDLADRAGKAAVGSGVGLAAGAAAPPLVAGLGWAANKVAAPIVSTVRGIMNPEKEAAKRLTGAFEADSRAGRIRMTEQEAADAAANGHPVTAMDRGGENVLDLGRSASNNSPEARATIEGAIGARVETQGERIEQGLARAAGAPLDDTAQAAQLKAQARKENKPAYQKAYNEGQGVWDDELAGFMEAPAVRQAVIKAERTGANRAVADGFPPVRSPFTTDDAGNIVPRMDKNGTRAIPNLQFWDHVQRNLSDAVEAAKRTGKNSEAADLAELQRQLLDKLDSLVPSFGQARAGAAAHFGAHDALEAGRKFATSGMTAQQAKPIHARMKPAERKLFAQGYAAARRDMLNKKGDRSDLSKAFLASEDDRQKAALALGQSEASKLEAEMHVEKIMSHTANELKGNSSTARQLAQMGLAGGVAGGYSNDWDWRATAIGAAGAAAGRRYGDKKVAAQLAKMLSSGDPKNLKIVQQLAAKSPKYMHALENMSIGLERLGTQEPVRSGAPALQRLGGMNSVYAEDQQSEVPRGGR